MPVKHPHPLFSIVMPTRNRGHLLQGALQTALSQTFDDYEIVVSDNGSTDGTVNVVRGLADPRIRYIRTPSDLSMPDSWEFALDKAQGEYITYLCDDDAILPQLLENIHRLIDSSKADVISWNSSHYYHSNWFESERRNNLQVAPFSGDVQTLDPRETLRAIFATLRAYPPCPRMLQSVCRRAVIERVRHRTGRLFHKTAPDYAASIGILTQIESHVYWDFPWHVIGTAKESNRVESLAYDGGRSIRRFFAEFDGHDVFTETQLPGYLASNVIVDTLLRMKAILTPELDLLDVDRARYFESYYAELGDLRARGADVSQYERDLRQVIGEAAWGALTNSAGVVVHRRQFGRARARSLARQVVNGSTWLRALERRLRREGNQGTFTGGIQVDGDTAGFTNITECARFAGSDFVQGFASLKAAWA